MTSMTVRSTTALVGALMIVVGVLVSAFTDLDLVAGVAIGVGFCLAVAGSRGFLARLLDLEPAPPSDERDESKAP